MIALKTNNLVKKFNGFAAVDGISLSVPAGAIYGFLGPNGAGKTTTLKMLVGMTEATSGTIEIFGEKVERGSLLKRSDIGFLPDVPGFYDWMNAVEFLDFCGTLYKLNKNERTKRIKELLVLVGLEKAKYKKIGTYSRGMKQRLGIAQALMNQPKIIFLDEPVSALDPLGRKEVMDVIAKLAGKVTVFFSSHILADVERICDRVVIIDQGKVVLEDSLASIKQVGLQHLIEIEVDATEDLEKLAKLEVKTWCKEAIMNTKSIRLDVEDIDLATQSIYAFLLQEKINVKKLVVVEPTLEDVFMKVVQHER